MIDQVTFCVLPKKNRPSNQIITCVREKKCANVRCKQTEKLKKKDLTPTVKGSSGKLVFHAYLRLFNLQYVQQVQSHGVRGKKVVSTALLEKTFPNSPELETSCD
mmetsp:Transcript_6879/g.10044  ORF Transcript_6879/g.10044 Transcript_6879/m.10044 type:complete len:105 (+) Transcript_6879:630-944(+)